MRDNRFFPHLHHRILAAVLSVCMLMMGAPATVLAESVEPDETVVMEEPIATEELDVLEEPEEVVAMDDAEEPSEPEAEEPMPELPAAVTLDVSDDASLDEPLDNDALLNAYVQQLLDAPLQGEEGQEDISLTSQSVPLQGIDATLYAQLRVLVSEVASGARTNTSFSIPVTDLFEKTTWSAEDLGVDSVVYTGDDGEPYIADEAVAAVRAIVNPHLKSVLVALVCDCPYDLYWLLNTRAMTMDYLTITATREGDAYYLTVATVKDEATEQDVDQYLHIGLRVAEGYRANPDNEFEVNPEKIMRANNAVINAQNVVNETVGMGPRERLYTFMQRICALVEYDHDAIDNDRPYGDPWQLINVFDGDSATNVVCEGYSKAFKYLCDLANISNVGVTLVTGPMGGGTGAGTGHMWNIVNMPDRRNYLVDVTNCDADAIGEPDLLFLAIPDDGTYDTQYVFHPQGDDLTYGYDQDTLGHYEPSELTLSTTAYDPSVVVPDPIDLSGATVSVTAEGLVYTGEELKPAVSVELNGATLNENVDYTLTYSNNVNAESGANVTVNGIGNYTGSASASFTIQRRPVTVHAGVVLKYYGYDDPDLTSGAYAEGTIGDDTVTCTFSRDAGESVGTYVLHVTGEEEQGNYQVSYENGAFTINPCPLSQAKVASIANQTYTGSEIKPAPKVTVNGKVLKRGTDYTLAWKNNVKLGTATLTVTGKGNYRDSVSVNFKIVKPSVAKATVSKIANQKYDGTVKKPRPTVKLGGKTLKLNTDYTLTYKNNQKAGTATITIKGKGSYTGTKSVTFKIVVMAGTWKKSGSRWWYQWKDGNYPKSVFLDISGKTYRFDASGWMLTGWQKIGAKYYYFGSDGVMRKNTWAGNYYLQADGTMATSKWIGRYHVDAYGKWDNTR